MNAHFLAIATTPETMNAPSPVSSPRKGRHTFNVQEALLSDIDRGVLTPGMALEERALAEKFDVSRTPVRDALKQLAQMGLVKLTPHAGAQIARKSIGELRALLEYVSELEPLCTKLAARRVDALQIARMEAANALCERCADTPEEYAKANEAFHDVIYDASHNLILANQIKAARRQVKMYRIGNLASPAHIQRSLEDHAAIVKAISSGDERRAMEAMQKHLPAGNTGFSEFLAKVPMHYFDNESANPYALMRL